MNDINLVKIFKALSCEQRFYLFKALYEWCETEENKDGDCINSEGMDKCFTKACCCMDLSKSTISHHLNVLKNAGFIKGRKEGVWIHYKLVNLEIVSLIEDLVK